MRRLASIADKSPNQLTSYGIQVKKDGVRRSAMDLMSQGGFAFSDDAIWPSLANAPRDVQEQLKLTLYTGYLQRQDADIRAFQRDESLKIPEDLNYQQIGNSPDATEISPNSNQKI